MNSGMLISVPIPVEYEAEGQQIKDAIGIYLIKLVIFIEYSFCSDRILTCRIKSICSPAKGGTGCYRFNYQPGS